MSIEANVEDETTISNESDVEDEKTKAPFTPRHGGRDAKTTTQGVSDTDKDLKEEVEKIIDVLSPQTPFLSSFRKKGRATNGIAH